jgi:hypothetical protein
VLTPCVGVSCHDDSVDWRKKGADPAELDALHPGVPAWIERQLIVWAGAVSNEEYFDEDVQRRSRPSVSILAGYETAVRRQSSLVHGYRTGGVPYLFATMDTDEFLDFVDYLVFVAGQRPNSDRLLEVLEELLSKAGSEWSVGERQGFASLVKRVPEGVAIAAAEIIRSRGLAGVLLGEAWHAAFGRSPDPEEAYGKAIKAVEEAGADVVSPKNSLTTLGTMIRDMTAQGDWKLPLGSEESDAPVRMAAALWKNEESRHGGNAYRKPTQEEAATAVMLAVPLVQWFTSGALARR